MLKIILPTLAVYLLPLCPAKSTIVHSYVSHENGLERPAHNWTFFFSNDFCIAFSFYLTINYWNAYVALYCFQYWSMEQNARVTLMTGCHFTFRWSRGKILKLTKWLVSILSSGQRDEILELPHIPARCCTGWNRCRREGSDSAASATAAGRDLPYYSRPKHVHYQSQTG